MTRTHIHLAAVSVFLFSMAYTLPAQEPVHQLILEVDEHLQILKEQLATQTDLRDVARHADATQAAAVLDELIMATKTDITNLLARRDLLTRDSAESVLMKAILQSLQEADQNHSKSASLSDEGEALHRQFQGETLAIKAEALQRTTAADPLAGLLEDNPLKESVDAESMPIEPPPVEPEVDVPVESNPAPLLIEKGDVIIALNSVEIATVAQFYRLVNNIPAGRELDLTVRRGPDLFRVVVTTLNRGSAIRSIGFTAGRKPASHDVFVLRILPTPSGSQENSLAARTHHSRY